MSLIYISGGIRSGKSGFAEKLAQERGTSVLYVATGICFDEEMEERIERHRTRRPPEWGLLEIPYELIDIPSQAKGYDVVLIDCLSAWVSNRLLQAGEGQIRDERISGEVSNHLLQWLEQLRHSSCTVIVISNEVGLGGVAMSPLGRWFQDLLGEANQQVARQADEVYAVLSGIPWRIK